MSAHVRPKLYGLLAEFEQPHDVVHAAEKAREEGYVAVDAFTPFPVEGLAEALGFRKSRLPLIVFIGAITGMVTGFLMQYWAAVIDYPVNIGGRPNNSWVMFIPITFEMTILFAVLSAVIGMLALNKLPAPHHPLFNVDRFELASRNHFFLAIEATDPKFELEQTKSFLRGLHASRVFEVEP